MSLKVEVVPEDGRTEEEEVNSDILAFQSFFCSQVDTSAPRLMDQEIAIIKTYLCWKKMDQEENDGEA